MKRKICDVNTEATNKLPGKMADGSGIGVHYVDAFIKPLKTTLEDGTKVACKRRGLKLTLTVGEQMGEGLMRRLDFDGDPVAMLDAALREAAQAAGLELTVENGAVFIA